MKTPICEICGKDTEPLGCEHYPLNFKADIIPDIRALIDEDKIMNADDK